MVVSRGVQEKNKDQQVATVVRDRTDDEARGSELEGKLSRTILDTDLLNCSVTV